MSRKSEINGSKRIDLGKKPEDVEVPSSSQDVEETPESKRRKLHRTYIQRWIDDIAKNGFSQSCSYVSSDVFMMQKHHNTCLEMISSADKSFENSDENSLTESITDPKAIKKYQTLDTKERLIKWYNQFKSSGQAFCGNKECNFVGMNLADLEDHLNTCTGAQDFSLYCCIHCRCGFSSHRNQLIHQVTCSETDKLHSYLKKPDNLHFRVIKQLRSDKTDELIVQPGPNFPKDQYRRRRAYRAEHKNSWILSLEKFKYVKCIYQNCYFIAMSLEDMIAHFGYCNGDSSFAKYVCPFCNGRVTSEIVLLKHIERSHPSENSHIKFGDLNSEKMVSKSTSTKEDKEEELKFYRRYHSLPKEEQAFYRRLWQNQISEVKFAFCPNSMCNFMAPYIKDVEVHLKTCTNTFDLETLCCRKCRFRLPTIEDLSRHVPFCNERKLKFSTSGDKVINFQKMKEDYFQMRPVVRQYQSKRTKVFPKNFVLNSSNVELNESVGANITINTVFLNIANANSKDTTQTKESLQMSTEMVNKDQQEQVKVMKNNFTQTNNSFELLDNNSKESAGANPMVYRVILNVVNSPDGKPATGMLTTSTDVGDKSQQEQVENENSNFTESNNSSELSENNSKERTGVEKTVDCEILKAFDSKEVKRKRGRPKKFEKGLHEMQNHREKSDFIENKNSPDLNDDNSEESTGTNKKVEILMSKAVDLKDVKGTRRSSRKSNEVGDKNQQEQDVKCDFTESKNSYELSGNNSKESAGANKTVDIEILRALDSKERRRRGRPRKFEKGLPEMQNHREKSDFIENKNSPDLHDDDSEDGSKMVDNVKFKAVDSKDVKRPRGRPRRTTEMVNINNQEDEYEKSDITEKKKSFESRGNNSKEMTKVSKKGDAIIYKRLDSNDLEQTRRRPMKSTEMVDNGQEEPVKYNCDYVGIKNGFDLFPNNSKASTGAKEKAKTLVMKAEEYDEMNTEMVDKNLQVEVNSTNCDFTETSNSFDSLENNSKDLKQTKRKPKKPIIDKNQVEPVKCGKCEFTGSRNNFVYHNMKIHSGLGWVEGEQPVDLNDEKLVIQLVKEAFKINKKAACEKCEDIKRSVMGFVSHVQFCGKSDEEKNAMKVMCPYCEGKYLKYSLAAHIKFSHPNPEGDEEDDDDEEEEVEELPQEGVESSGKRRSAIRAVSKFQQVFNENDEADLEPETSYILYEKSNESIPKLNPKLNNLWYKLKRENKKIPCNHKNCQTRSSDVIEAKKHHFNCPFLPDKVYMCELCDFYSVQESDVKSHLNSHRKYVKQRKLSDEEVKPEENSAENEEDNDEEEEEEDDDNEEEDVVNSDEEKVDEPKKRKKKRQNDDGIYKKPKLSEEGDIELKLKLNFCKKEKLDNLRNIHFYCKGLEMTLEKERLALESLTWPETWPDLHTSREEWLQVPPAQAVRYFPELAKSVAVRFSESTNNWRRFERFSGDLIDDVPVMFTGGSVRSMSWCKISFKRMIEKNQRQYLAVSTAKKLDYLKDIHDRSSVEKPTLFQIWDCGALRNDTPKEIPRFALGMVLKGGEIWDLAWFPNDTYAEETPKRLRRLGLLATASEDGAVRIWSICDPSQLGSTDGLPVYVTDPVVILIANTDIEESCVKLAIGSNGVLAGGFGNGTIAVWNLKNTDSPFCKKFRKSKIIRAHLVFQAHKNAVTALTFCPTNSRYLSTAALDRNVKIWDLDSPSVPIEQYNKDYSLDNIWTMNWPSVIHNFDDVMINFNKGVVRFIKNIFTDRNQSTFSMEASCLSLSFSDWLNALCGGSITGEVKLRYLKNLIQDQKRHQSTVSSVQLEKLNEHDVKEGDDEFPRNYDDMDLKFGLVFSDNLGMDKTKPTKSEGHPEEFPIRAINKVAFNPNYESFTHIALGYNCGLIRIRYLVELNSSENLDNFFKKVRQGKF